MRTRRRLVRPAALALGLALLAQPAGGAGRIELSLADIGGPGFAARGVRALVALDGGQPALQVDVAELQAAGRRWQALRLICQHALAKGQRLECVEGELRWQGGLHPLAFTLDLAEPRLAATARVDQGVVEASVESAAGAWRVQAKARALPVKRLAGLLPKALPPLTAGTMDAALSASGGKGGPALASGSVTLAGVAFSDAAGLRAGEGIGAVLAFSARSDAGGWQGEADLDWRAGEAFWQPLYLRAGHRLHLAGGLADRTLTLREGRLEMAKVGSVRFSGGAPLDAPSRASGRLSARALDLQGLYAALLQPLLAGTALAELEAVGRVDLELEAERGSPTRALLALDGVSVADRGGRFELYELSGRLPWSARGATEGALRAAGGRVLQLPLGAFELQPRLEGRRAAVPALTLPLLGGELRLVDLEAERTDAGWRWQVSGGLSPVSMGELATAFGWPPFAGAVAAGLPRVRYEKQTLQLDGALLVQAFDGAALVENLAIVEPLGLAPRLTADVDMRGLDLELLTRAFSFGRITGRVDVSVKGLELSRWRPVAFDARVASSPGDYPRRISQRAVENISALGGAGAAAALQRTFLRFFEDFSYRELGLTCVLRSGVCTMGGVDEAPHGYVIVKGGGGVPAITVLGYNRQVDWSELVQRLARITRGGPVVK